MRAAVRKGFLFLSYAMLPSSMIGCNGGAVVVSADQGVPVSDRSLDIPADSISGEGGPDIPFDWGDYPSDQLGTPCVSNEDCLSGVCIESHYGPVCTISCLTNCPPDWSCRAMRIGADVMSVCVPEGMTLCLPCEVDSQCADGVCHELDEGRFCTRDCSGTPCSNGFSCVALEENGKITKQCVPSNGTCSCREPNGGQQRACKRANVHGICQGFETCEPAAGWVGCTALVPAVEVCDGIDNDCSGVADDALTRPESPCFIETDGIDGHCPGQWSCGGEVGWTCLGSGPHAETCDYIDNDCDDSTDEDFRDAEGRYVTAEHCGACSTACEARVPFTARVVCDTALPTPQCVIAACQKGYVLFDNTCIPELSNLCQPCSDDNDCGTRNDRCLDIGGARFCARDCSAGAPQGTDCPTGFDCRPIEAGVLQCLPKSGTCQCTPANHGVKRPCTVTNAYGTCTGVETCDGTKGWVGCTAATPTPETCDATDNDCNGFVDDQAAPPAAPCEVR